MRINLSILNQVVKPLWVKYVFFTFLILICVVPDVLAVLYAPIYIDSGYYLSIVERINDGLIPYTDFTLGYTPFVFYFLFLLKYIFSIGICYEFYLIIHFVIQALCALLVYQIGLWIIKRKDFSFYAAILFLLTSHWNEGNYVLLETPSLIWGLLAVYLTLKCSQKIIIFIFIGVCVALAFLSKQYGIVFLGLIIFLLIFNEAKWKQILFLLIGFLLPVIFCGIIWKSPFFETLSGNYGFKITFLSHISKLFEATKHFFLQIFPVLLVGLIFIPFILRNADKIKVRNYIVLLLGIMGFLLQFYFWYSPHYFLYIIPFASILTFLILSDVNKFKWIYSFFLIITIGYSLYSVYFNRVDKIYLKRKDIKQTQYNVAREILTKVDKSRTLYISSTNLIAQYYLTNIVPPNLKTIGYTFGPALNLKTHLLQLKSADFVLNSTLKPDFDYYESPESLAFFEKGEKIKISSNSFLFKKLLDE